MQNSRPIGLATRLADHTKLDDRHLGPHSQGRRCADSDCITVLSTYHAGPYCYACELRQAGREDLAA